MTDAPPTLLHKLKRTSLVTQIVIGLIAGILLAWLAPAAALSVAFIGKVFVSALKAVAPILVFVLVMASIANHKHGQETHIRPILILYLFGTFAAAVVAVIASMLFPSSLILVMNVQNTIEAISGWRSTMRPPSELPIRPTAPKPIRHQPTSVPSKPARRSRISAR